MSAMQILLGSSLVETIGWVLVHFAWQGTLVGGLVGVALCGLRRGDPRTRYAVLCAGMLAMAALSVATGLVVHPRAVPVDAGASAVGTVGMDDGRLATGLKAAVRPDSGWSSLAGRIERALPGLLLVWLCLWRLRSPASISPM